jgi:hypothetical protein
MTTAFATLHRYKFTALIDAGLLLTLYLLPSISHLVAFPLYKFEPMRIALIIALLFTNRANTYLIAFTIPVASALITGHPELFKAVLMGIELSALVAVYSYFVRMDRFPAFAALIMGIVFSKILYYTMKSVALSAGFLSGSLVSTPVQTQLVLALGTAAVFGLVEYYRTKFIIRRVK